MTNFETIKPEKRELIINAAMHEFASNGYQNTSTNQIVERAGISKGSLFQYFGSKDQLFHYLFDLAHGLMQKSLYDSIDLKEPDLFVRLENLAYNLTDLLRQFPETMDFVMKAKKETAEPIASEIARKKRKTTMELLDRAFHNIDKSLLRKDIDFEYIRFTLLSCMDTYYSESIPFPGSYANSHEKQKELFEFFKKLLTKGTATS